MIKNIFVVVIGIISLMYILNLGVGFVELIPDYVPFVGNLDEGGAAILLLMCLRYFGIDLANFFVRKQKNEI